MHLHKYHVSIADQIGQLLSKERKIHILRYKNKKKRIISAHLPYPFLLNQDEILKIYICMAVQWK
jgi:hypothetical protein